MDRADYDLKHEQSRTVEHSGFNWFGCLVYGVCLACQTTRRSTAAKVMDRVFKVAILACIFAIAICLFRQSSNGRYQYASSGNQGVVLDTRSGEFWTENGYHFEPRAARITLHEPLIVDEATSDHRTHAYLDCLHSGRKDCLAQLLAEVRKDAESAASSEKTGPPGIPQSGVANVSDIKNAADDASNKH